MANQVDINEKMRAILLDWLVEVHRMFKLLPETLFLVLQLPLPSTPSSLTVTGCQPHRSLLTTKERCS